MATLAQVTKETRIIVKIATVVLIIVSSVFVSLKVYGFIKRVFFPPPPAAPEEKFGKLPSIPFPATGNQGLTFRINTVTGSLPSFPDRVRVYKVKQPEATILALQNARERAKRLGFSDEETKLSDTLYSWRQKETGAILTYDILSKHFKISSNYISSLASTTPFPDKNGILQIAHETVRTLQDDVADIAFDQSQVTYFSLSGRELSKLPNDQNSQVARIDIMHADIEVDPFNTLSGRVNALKVYYPKLDQSIMYFLVAPTSSGLKVVEAEFPHSIPDKIDRSTYPIKTSQQAYDDLTAGNAYVVKSGDAKIVDITDVSLGYYIGKEEQAFIVPIYIFKGKDFTAYVHAIVNSSITSSPD